MGSATVEKKPYIYIYIIVKLLLLPIGGGYAPLALRPGSYISSLLGCAAAAA